MDKQEEISLFNKFREAYDMFPDGTPSFNDKPDVIFCCINNNYKIGIEITETFHSQRAKQKSSDRNKFTGELIKQIQKSIDYGFYIDIDFNDSFDILKRNTKKEIKEILLQICLTKLSILADKEQTWMGGSFGEGEKWIEIEGINEITIGKLIDCEPWNVESTGGPIPNFQDTDLEIILRKKNESLKGYSLCDEYWLIIKEGDYYVGSFKEFSVNPVVSGFDKIFIYRNLENQIIKLK